MNFYSSVFLIVLQLVFLEGILSIDNAAVLGAMVAPLPTDLPIPWPRWLQRLGSRFDSLLGKQRLAALRVGLLGAYAGRGTMLFITSFLINNGWIRLVGAAYLIRLAFNELGDTTPGVDTEEERLKALHGASFWSVVLSVEVMDLIFSIDNVIAAVSLSNEIWVVMLGVGIGILAMRFAAGWFSYAVEREPILKPAAYVLILNIGIQLILEQLLGVEITDPVKFLISITIILGAVFYAHNKFLQKFKPMVYGLSFLFGVINKAVDLLLLPFKLFFQFLVNGRSIPNPEETK